MQEKYAVLKDDPELKVGPAAYADERAYSGWYPDSLTQDGRVRFESCSLRVQA